MMMILMMEDVVQGEENGNQASDSHPDRESSFSSLVVVVTAVVTQTLCLRGVQRTGKNNLCTSSETNIIIPYQIQGEEKRVKCLVSSFTLEKLFSLSQPLVFDVLSLSLSLSQCVNLLQENRQRQDADEEGGSKGHEKKNPGRIASTKDWRGR